MKAIRYIAILILAAALAACGEKSEPYYTTSYPVSRVEATVTLGAAATATAEDEPEPDAAPITGSFNKEPDKPDQLRFFYEDADYTYAVSYYSEEGKSLTLLTVDLTAKYQALYPTAGITKVERLEYTTHPF